MPSNAEYLTALVEAVLDGRGTTEPSLRRAIEARAASLSGGPREVAAVPDDLSAWVDKVARHAYKTTDSDVESLKAAGYAEDQIFEVTVAAALGAARGRLDRALAMLDETKGEPS